MANNIDSPIESEAAGLPPPGDPMDELLLSRYIEGRLEIAESKALEASLRTNAAARRRLDALREEERLVREALEPLAEPSKRLGDRVIATLHLEERSRLQALRTLRVRRHIFAALAAAASLILCIWLVKPRDAVGTALSGTAATLLTPNGERKPFAKDNRFYEGDELITALGQFVRLRLNNGVVLDLDEHSKLCVEKARPMPAFRLESGRLGVNTQQADVLVHLPQGQVRALSGSLVDVWLPQPPDAIWPELLAPEPHDALGSTGFQPVGQDARGAAVAQASSLPVLHPAAITVLSGTAYVGNERLPGGISITTGCRVLLGKQTRSVTPLDLGASRVIESRQGQTWHTLEGVSPQDRKVIGLLEPPDFDDLGRRLNMAGNTPAQVAQGITEALALLQDAEQTTTAGQRAKKLAAAQQALRLAYAPLSPNDEHRAWGRLLEGLAHLERGRALLASGALAEDGGTAFQAVESTRTAAAAAFDAARVAFEEALNPDNSADLPLPTDGYKRSDWARQLAAGPSVTLRDLSPANQAALLATFHHGVALCWLARVGAAGDPAQSAAGPIPDSTVAKQAASEFDALRPVLGRSVEALAARLAEGLALEAAAAGTGDRAPAQDPQAKAWREKAAEAFEEVLAAPLAGWAEPSRKCGDGLKQAALLALVRAELANDGSTGVPPVDTALAQARVAAEDFRILYPLDSAGPVAREIKRLLHTRLLSQASSAFQAGQYQAAVEAYDEWLRRTEASGADAGKMAPGENISARLRLIKALLALKNGVRARHEAAALSEIIPPEQKSELEALSAQAQALPGAPEKPLLPAP